MLFQDENFENAKCIQWERICLCTAKPHFCVNCIKSPLIFFRVELNFFIGLCIAIILMGKREMIALLKLSSWCLVMVERLFLAVPRGCLQFVIVVFPDHTHLLFL